MGDEKQTSADASGGPVAGPKVALQPLKLVARLGPAAIFIQLSRTHSAAVTAVWHQTDSRRAFGQLCRARAHSWAAGENLNGKKQQLVTRLSLTKFST